MPQHWFWKKRKQKPMGLIASGGYASATMTTFQTFEPLMPPQVLQDRGLAIEPIVGYRGYHALIVDGDDGLPYLTSYNGVAWPHRKPLDAMCGDNVFADHDAPKVDCGCGIYAWNEKMAPQNCSNNNALWGEVYLWGDVLICEHGYRAEIAYPKTLHIRCAQTRASMRLRDGLEEAYGVPVTLTDPEAKVEEEFNVATFMTGSTGVTFPYAVPGYQIPPIPPPGPSPSV